MEVSCQHANQSRVFDPQTAASNDALSWALGRDLEFLQAAPSRPARQRVAPRPRGRAPNLPFRRYGLAWIGSLCSGGSVAQFLPINAIENKESQLAAVPSAGVLGDCAGKPSQRGMAWLRFGPETVARKIRTRLVGQLIEIRRLS